MAVKLESVQYQDIMKGSSDTVGWLLANMGENIQIYVDYYIEDIVFSNEDNKLILAPDPSLVDTLDNNKLIYCEDGVSFSDFKQGDTIDIFNADGGTTDTRTIAQVLNDGLIRVTGADFSLTELAGGSYVANVTPFQGHRYFYNFIENNDGTNFVSLIDGETQMLKTNEGNAADPSIKTMIFTGKSSYQIGGAIISGQGVANKKQRFRIIHNTVITPFFLFDQLQDLIDGVAPEYFLANKCFKHVFKLECNRSANDPNPAQTLTVDEIVGNCGWVGENYNGGINYFSIPSATYKRVSDNEPIPTFQFDVESECNFLINCVSPAQFSVPNTRVVVNIVYLPEDSSQYVDNGRDQKTNFVYDTCFRNVNQAATVGANFGTPLQVITSFQVLYYSPTQISCKVKVNLGSLAQEIISQGQFKRYMIWVSTETTTLSRANSDKVNLVVSKAVDYFEDLEDIDIVTTTTKFLSHPDDDPETQGEGFLNAFPVDDIVADTDFSIDFTDGKPRIIKSITPGIVLKKTGEQDIELEEFPVNTQSSPLEGGIVPFIDIEQNRVFKIADNDIRKVLTIKRRSDLDVGDVKHWVIDYPFMHRWEYWVSLGILPDLPAGIFDITKPLNGINHFWHRYTTITGWKIYHRLRFVFEIDGEEFEQVIDKIYSSYDFLSNPEFVNESIKSYNSDDVEIVSGGQAFVQGFEDTKIIATFEKTSGDLPNVEDVNIVFFIGRKEQDGIENVRRASSKYELDANSWFKSIDASNKVLVENPSAGVYTGAILVDYTKLPDDEEFTIYARIYDPTPLTPEDGKITEAGDLKIMEVSEEIKIIE